MLGVSSLTSTCAYCHCRLILPFVVQASGAESKRSWTKICSLNYTHQPDKSDTMVFATNSDGTCAEPVDLLDRLHDGHDNGHDDGNDAGVDDDYEIGEHSLLPVPFLNVYENLPASASENHPHIIDTDLCCLEFADPGANFDVKIQDAVATLLYKISKDILGQFLDKRTTSFKLVQSIEGILNKELKLVIWKEGAQVLVGSYLDFVEADFLRWNNVVRCTVNSDGSWNLISATSATGDTKRELHHVWSGKFIRTRWSSDIERMIYWCTKEESASGFGESMINHEFWDCKTKTKWDIATTMTV
ncbi:uncharacterized protein J4E88_001726 [Alternaria novae-zelandiae]|uniref:uncharacterized protein n=1 Tax=Alternaria novae-zelandiae TaxID=430562 RepID=UPI0020C4F64D|nr:uncharacterized protein J4E88_001726 [Alternaria novae-zelandiae]KAI4693355.1 hypothetical protein J4E88_001726 [Alternaria novae-zelandiae]